MPTNINNTDVSDNTGNTGSTSTMSCKEKPPNFSSDKGYERYKMELLAWRVVTDMPGEKQAITVALSLPEDHNSGIRARVFDECDLQTLKAEDGLDQLIKFMDKALG